MSKDISSQSEKFSRDEFKEIYPFESHYIEISGHQMHYIEEGDGEILLMVHGNPTWSFYYRRMIDHFKKNYRVIAPDHIGYGYSEKPTDYNYTLGNQIKNLEEFIEKRALKNITLVMHDWGGAFAMGYAVRHAENVKRLVFLNTGAFTIPEEILDNKPWQLMMVRTPLLGKILVRGFNAFSKFAIFLAIKDKERRTKQVKAGYLAPYDSWKHRVAVLKAVEDIPFNEDDPAYEELKYIEERLDKFKETPKIFFWGEKDFVFNNIVLDKWLEFYPDAEAHKFPNAGHYVLEDAYPTIIPEVDNFLKQNPI